VWWPLWCFCLIGEILAVFDFFLGKQVEYSRWKPSKMIVLYNTCILFKTPQTITEQIKPQIVFFISWKITLVALSYISFGTIGDVSCRRRAYAESALPGPMAGRPWAMAELTRRALSWNGMSRRHLQETDEPNQMVLLFWSEEVIDNESILKSKTTARDRLSSRFYELCNVIHLRILFNFMSIFIQTSE